MLEEEGTSPVMSSIEPRLCEFLPKVVVPVLPHRIFTNIYGYAFETLAIKAWKIGPLQTRPTLFDSSIANE
jgi:hypothetical protein